MNMLYVLRLFIYFVCFAASLFALSALDFQRAFKKQVNPAAAQLLYLFLAMALAYLLGQFLMGLMLTFWNITPSGEVTGALPLSCYSVL